MNNITQNIKSKIGKNLHNKKYHPIQIIKQKIYDYFGETFIKFDDLNPIVSIVDNFDKLLISDTHPSRKETDTYYVSNTEVLRTHTSAHQNILLSNGHKKFLVTGDVYRKDTIDSTHYPIFHQMEGVKICDNGIDCIDDLKTTIVGLIQYLFPNCEYVLRTDYFPFTDPSFEVDVLYNGEQLEVLGCGKIHQNILNNCGLGDRQGQAFGLGLERLAMILFKIKDIRYFQTDDNRFHNQFTSNEIIEFTEYSKHPPCLKDISFQINDSFNENDFCEIVRENSNDLVESIKLIDEFIHPKTNKISKCYTITYRSNDRSLTNDEINNIQHTIRLLVETKLNVTLR